MTAELILYAVVAAGLVFWLRSVLGTRHGEERERPNPFTAPPEKTAAREGEIDLPAAADKGVTLGLGIQPILPRGVTIENEAAERGLFDIARADRSFDISQFTQGAQDAFAIIVEAFAEGDRDILKNLLTDQVYSTFDAALREREGRGETVETEIHAVRRCEILDTRLDRRMAYITLRFIADETCVVRDKDGQVLSGDPDRVTEMNDIWTFVRDVKDRDPRWLVQETRDGDVKEDTRTPVPDA